ncbi:MAG: type I restriction-modification system subunit M [Phycisphaerales bacterium]
MAKKKRTKNPSSKTRENGTGIGFEEKLWQAADKLRGSIDAAEYKHVVLGLLFLKYISDAFETRREQLRKELDDAKIPKDRQESLLENPDEYTAERVFWVPEDARWDKLQAKAIDPKIAQHIDKAIEAVEASNSTLKGKLPRDYARRGINPTKLGELITEVIAQIGFKGTASQARDMLGRVYEYFLGKFAAAEGKLGGEFYTPRCIVRLLVEMLEPYEGRIYDPACGSGGMFTQAERFVEAHGGNRRNVSIFGQESNPTTWRLAHMNLAIHSIEANLSNRSADTFLNPQHPDLKADFVLANPPFNVSDWGGKLLENDVRWQFGTPPAGNANYAWIQHFIHHLAPPNGTGGGMAGFVMANGSLSSTSGGEGEIRRKIIEADLVDCIVAMPAQLFYTTGIPVCLWFLTRDKTRNPRKRDRDTNPWRDRSGEVLFIDARKLGTMETRTLRVLSGTENDDQVEGTQLLDNEKQIIPGTGDPRPSCDIGRIVTAYRQWRGEQPPAWWDASEHGEWSYEDVPGFCKAAPLEEIAKHGHVLTPGRYVGAEVLEDDGEPFEEKYPRLVAELGEELEAGTRLSNLVRSQLGLVTLSEDNDGNG